MLVCDPKLSVETNIRDNATIDAALPLWGSFGNRTISARTASISSSSSAPRRDRSLRRPGDEDSVSSRNASSPSSSDMCPVLVERHRLGGASIDFSAATFDLGIPSCGRVRVGLTVKTAKQLDEREPPIAALNPRTESGIDDRERAIEQIGYGMTARMATRRADGASFDSGDRARRRVHGDDLELLELTGELLRLGRVVDDLDALDRGRQFVERRRGRRDPR